MPDVMVSQIDSLLVQFQGLNPSQEDLAQVDASLNQCDLNGQGQALITISIVSDQSMQVCEQDTITLLQSMIAKYQGAQAPVQPVIVPVPVFPDWGYIVIGGAVVAAGVGIAIAASEPPKGGGGGGGGGAPSPAPSGGSRRK